MGQKSNKYPKIVQSPRDSGLVSSTSNQSETTDSSPQDTPRKIKKRTTKPISKKSQEHENFSQKKLDKLFEKYKDADSDGISPVGATQFLKDLDIMPTDVAVPVLAWHLKCRQIGIFTREEFVGGLRQLGLDSVEKIKARLDSFREELQDKEKLNQIYRFSWDFYKEGKERKTIDLELVDSMLQILIPNHTHISHIRKYLNKKQKQYKVITFDQWMGILDFSNTVGPEFNEWDEDGAWPSLIDDFVDWAKKGHSGDTDDEPQDKN